MRAAVSGSNPPPGLEGHADVGTTATQRDGVCVLTIDGELTCTNVAEFRDLAASAPGGFAVDGRDFADALTDAYRTTANPVTTPISDRKSHSAGGTDSRVRDGRAATTRR